MTKIINLDELKREPLVSIIVDGKRHDMHEATVSTFIENLTALEGLSMNASPIEEIEVVVGIVLRAFPTLTDKQVRSWSLDVIRHLSEVARGVNGEIATNDADEAAEAAKSGNDQPAS